jgi:signal transduction histidine kinase
VRPRSLTLRLALLTGLWVSAGLLVAWFLVAHEAATALERSFNARLLGLLDAVVGSLAVSADGTPTLTRAISEPRFAQPLSGAYWQIETADGRVATSRSLWDQTLPLPPAPGEATRIDTLRGPKGEHLRLAERSVVPPPGGRPLLVAVAVAHDPIDHEIDRLTHGLALGLALLGAGLVAGTVLAVSLVLAPLRRLRQGIAALRAGESERLQGVAGTEVQPLIAEIEALVAQNRATVERARGHVGTLAHALRTSLAVLRNALERPGGADLDCAREQLAATERLVAHHLARARAAALRGATANDVPPAAVAEEIASALRRLFAWRDLRILVCGDTAPRVRCERQDLAEMLGNLMENACKWAASTVVVTVAATTTDVRLAVDDDGPGLPEAAVPQALARGGRLDETTAGSGLGLAISAELVSLYGGRLELGRSDRGGLRATLLLPASRSAAHSPPPPAG